MRYRKLGKTDMRISELSLGTVALGMPYGIGANTPSLQGVPPPDDNEAIRHIHHAIEQGINFFDTARACGRSEEVLGLALCGRRDKVYVATNISCNDQHGKVLLGRELVEHMTESLHTSLRLLQTPSVDVSVLHSASTDLLEDGAVIDMLKRYRQLGTTRYIGASTYGTVAPRKAIAHDLDVLQVAFNILNQRMSDEVFPLADVAGVGIVVRSVNLQGVLSPRVDYLPSRLDALRTLAAAVRHEASRLTPSLTLAEAALKFVLAQDNIATALVGVGDIAELDASLTVLRSPLWSEDIVDRFKRLRCDDPYFLDPSQWGLP